MRLRLALLVLLAPLACERADDGAQARAQALQSAAEELGAARAAFEADRTALQAELAELRKAVDAVDAKLDALAAERARRGPAREPPDASGFPLFEGREPTADESAVVAAVRCESETRCTIDRAYVETLAIDPASLAKQARVVPYQRDGETVGYKLYGIRPGSLPKAIGLRNGDLVHSADGKALTSLEQVLEIHAGLGHAKSLTLGIDRKGLPLTLTLEVVDGP